MANLASSKPATPAVRSQPLEVQPSSAFSIAMIADDAARAHVGLQVRRIHDSIRRTTMEIIEIGRALTEIKNIIDHGPFESLCQAEFGMDSRVARRFISAARYADEHLADRPEVAQRVSPTVLYRLAQGDVPAQVLDEALAAGGGKQIMPADIRAAMQRIEERLEEKDDQLDQALTDLAAATAELEDSRKRGDQAELRAARLADQSDRMSRNLSRAQEEITQLALESGTLQDQITELKKRAANPETVEVQVPTLPAGFATLQDAIKAKEQELRDVQNALAKAEERMSEAQRQLATVQGQVADTQASADILSAFRADIQALCAKYPAALVAAMAGDNPGVAVESEQIAEHLRSLADQIAAARPGARKAAIKAV